MFLFFRKGIKVNDAASKQSGSQSDQKLMAGIMKKKRLHPAQLVGPSAAVKESWNLADEEYWLSLVESSKNSRI